jgi:hypothetical protein
MGATKKWTTDLIRRMLAACISAWNLLLLSLLYKTVNIQNITCISYEVHTLRITQRAAKQTLCERERKKNVWNQEENHVTHSFPLEVSQQKHVIVCYIFKTLSKHLFPSNIWPRPLMSDRPHLARSQFHSIPSLRYTRTCFPVRSSLLPSTWTQHTISLPGRKNLYVHPCEKLKLDSWTASFSKESCRSLHILSKCAPLLNGLVCFHNCTKCRINFRLHKKVTNSEMIHSRIFLAFGKIHCYLKMKYAQMKSLVL